MEFSKVPTEVKDPNLFGTHLEHLDLHWNNSEVTEASRKKQYFYWK